ncbi:MAG: glycosyltransferase, partial [Caldilineaceae bacterium]|nr:glycosyltransferase [Caldilineaceae bacterium]
LEAMACGTPVVAANRSALPEVVGSAGLLVDPFDVEAIAAAIDTVLHDSRLHQSLVQAGLAQGAQFSWTKMAGELVQIYQKLLTEDKVVTE